MGQKIKRFLYKKTKTKVAKYPSERQHINWIGYVFFLSAVLHLLSDIN